jgi:hypothetical protein
MSQLSPSIEPGLDFNLPDDTLSDEEATASLNGDLFSEDEGEITNTTGLHQARQVWRVDHTSGNYKFKRKSIHNHLKPWILILSPIPSCAIYRENPL